MSCTASYKKRKDLEYVKTMAGHQANMEEKNMQVFKTTRAGVGVIYDYEAETEGRSNVVAVIKFRRNKGKNVLQNTGDGKQKPVKEKPKKRVTRKPAEE